MEEKEGMQTNSPNTSVNRIPPKEEKNRDLGVVILNILLALVTVLLLGYIAYRNGYINLDNILNVQKEQEIDSQEGEETVFLEDESSLVLETYEGEYLSAIIPAGWEIREYFDGEGSEMIDPGTTYTGLTGVQILNEGREIMKLEGVSGIGFVGCRELPRFEDSSTEYEQMQQDLNDEVMEEEIEYLDYTDVLYSEFQWFEKRFRRIGAALYYDTVEGDEFFEPQCEVSFFRLQELGFEDEGGYTGDTYMYTISQIATEDELRILDQILISMTAN